MHVIDQCFNAVFGLYDLIQPAFRIRFQLLRHGIKGAGQCAKLATAFEVYPLFIILLCNLPYTFRQFFNRVGNIARQVYQQHKSDKKAGCSYYTDPENSRFGRTVGQVIFPLNGGHIQAH
ncbi:hypothetical protein D3C87_1746790 [compost metagenome]